MAKTLVTIAQLPEYLLDVPSLLSLLMGLGAIPGKFDFVERCCPLQGISIEDVIGVKKLSG